MKLYVIKNHHPSKTRNAAQTLSAKAKDIARFTSKNVQSTPKNVRDSAQETLASAKDTVQLAYAQVQKRMNVGWHKTLVWLTTAVAIAGTFIQKNIQQAQKDLKKAQKNLQKRRSPLQGNVNFGLA